MKSEQLIKDLLKQGESEQLEFKESVRKDTVGKTICGFLNKKGGQLLLGIRDDKTIVGVKNAEKIKAELEQYLFEELVPEAPVMVSVEDYDDNQLLLLKVWEGSKQPYIFDGSIYYRIGDSTHRATSKEISELIHKRKENDIHWERQAALGVELEDLDIEEIKKTMLKDMVHSLSNTSSEPIDFLSYYGLYQNGNFTNAAVILFAKNPTRFIPQARVRVAFLKEGKTDEVFADDKLLEGNLFQNIEAIQKFLENNLSFTRKFDKTEWLRTDGYTYPMAALREGVLNALVHRDYGLSSSALSIIIYSERLEITNSGKSPYKQSELKKSHLSMPFNPDIAQLVFLRGYIEKIGRGTLKIVESCKQAGLKAPVWEIGEQTVKLTFFSESNIANRLKEVVDEAKLDGAIDGAIDGAKTNITIGAAVGTLFPIVVPVISLMGIIGGSIFSGMTNKVKDNLTKLLQTIAATEGLRAPDYIKVIDVSERTMERYLQQLKDTELIEFRGEAAQTGGYYLTEKLKEKLKNKPHQA